ncbi:DUF4249 domain-containing protein [Bacteroidota bacterium]
MKKTRLIIHIAILSIISILSCEEVIEIDLNSTDPKIVVEANITDDPGPYLVKLSWTEDYFEPSEFIRINNAFIVIADDKGIIDTLSEDEPGIYYTSKIQGVPGNTYTLRITINGDEIIASSTMPDKIELDAINYEYILAPTPHDEDGYRLKCEFQDPEDEENFYRFKVYQNDTLYYDNKYDIYLWDDKFFDGNYVDLAVKRRGTFPLKINDSMRIELLIYNEVTFMYYTTLLNSITEYTEMEIMRSMVMGSFAPANPETNLSYEVVGYFAAYCVSEQRAVIID